jgi:hypothetical protein
MKAGEPKKLRITKEIINGLLERMVIEDEKLVLKSV